MSFCWWLNFLLSPVPSKLLSLSGLPWNFTASQSIRSNFIAIRWRVWKFIELKCRQTHHFFFIWEKEIYFVIFSLWSCLCCFSQLLGVYREVKMYLQGVLDIIFMQSTTTANVWSEFREAFPVFLLSRVISREHRPTRRVYPMGQLYTNLQETFSFEDGKEISQS